MSETEISRMQEELGALVVSWVDRGATLHQACQVVLGCGMRTLCEVGESLALVAQVTRDIWCRHGGKP